VEFSVRVFLSLLLVYLISSCPFICGSAEMDHLAHAPEPTHQPSHPAHCPQDDDACICSGAISSVDVRLPDVDHVGLPTNLALHSHAHCHPVAHLAWDGSPAGLAGWGDAVTIRAVLQNFRC
jgi:hypothetical protein